jgi:hypothetical protein
MGSAHITHELHSELLHNDIRHKLLPPIPGFGELQHF